MRFIALLGNPNSGKSTLFNELTGAKQHVGNWPGVTVEKKEGKLKGHKDITLVDLPGIYSLSPYTLEEVVSRDYIIKEKPNAIINIIDSTNLERNLYLTTQAIETGVPVVVALNMMDLIEKRGLKIDLEALSKALGGIPIVPISALENKGLDKLIDEAIQLSKDHVKSDTLHYGEAIEASIKGIIDVVGLNDASARYHAIKLIENDERVIEDLKLTEAQQKEVKAIVEKLEDSLDNDGETLITNSRYDFITGFISDVINKPAQVKDKLTFSDKIDSVVTNRFLALPIFALVMFVVYYISIHTIGGQSQDWVGEYLIDPFGGWMEGFLTDIGASDWIVDLVVNGIIAGVGAVLTFVPQIMLLFMFLSFLEGCGYMSRIAFIMDRIFRRFGLSGKSFIPFLMATGCAVPSIMATRTIENDNDRRMTIIITSFMPCGAKLPIIVMIGAALFPDYPFLAPAMYLVAIFAIILSGILLKQTPLFSGDPAPFIIELPEYRLPKFKNVVLMMWEKAKGFIQKAGTVIFVASVVIWFLSSYDFSFEAVDVNDSMMASIGSVVAPIFAPLGFGSWQAAAGAFAGLVAKENLVATMGILYNLGEGLEEGSEPELVEAVRAHFNVASGMAYLLFNLFCIPCIAAMGAIKREMGSWGWTLFAFFYQTAFAYILALLVYQIGSRLI